MPDDLSYNGYVTYKKMPKLGHREKEDQTQCEFFDFYALNLLEFFAGEKTLNHSVRAERITNLYEEVTERMYQKIYRALLYSVVREFRHFCYETYNMDDQDNLYIDRGTYQYYWRMSMRVYRKYNTFGGQKAFKAFLDGNSDQLPIQPNLNDILFCFNHKGWNSHYGGKNWAKATALLLDLPRTISQKQVWIDRVLDLQHNTGHILNKTDFHILSAQKRCRRADQGLRNKRSPLNYRRYATTISDLIRYSSVRVRKLATANMNYIPEMIR